MHHAYGHRVVGYWTNTNRCWTSCVRGSSDVKAFSFNQRDILSSFLRFIVRLSGATKFVSLVCGRGIFHCVIIKSA